MDRDRDRRREAQAASLAADRLDALAEMADLMGDPEGAQRLHEEAAINRMHAMALLDD